MKVLMSNGQILGIMNAINSESGKEMLKKKLPIKLVYALRRSTPEIEKAYKAYADSLQDLCNQYGAQLPTNGAWMPYAENQDQQKEMDNAIAELLNTKVDVDVHVISPSILEEYDDYHYDPLSFSDVDRLWWLLDESENDNESE